MSTKAKQKPAELKSKWSGGKADKADRADKAATAAANSPQATGGNSGGSSKSPENQDSNNNQNAAESSGGQQANQQQDETDRFKKFEGDGVVFKAKLIGSELVMEPRGDKMCQNSIQRLKAIIKGQKCHKRRISLKISYSGVRVYDEKSSEILHHHEVGQISFISSDDTDSRTFGYVCDVSSANKAHQFICFKTTGPAAQVMSTLSSLFEASIEKARKEGGAAAAAQASDGPSKEMTAEEEAAKRRDQLISSSPSPIVSATAADAAAAAVASPPTTLDFAPIEPSKKRSLFEATTTSSFATTSLDTNNDDSACIFADFSSEPSADNSQTSPFELTFSTVPTTPSASFALAPSAPQPPPPPQVKPQASFDAASQSPASSAPATTPAAASTLTWSTTPATGGAGHTDKYAVFNDIDNLPSIFESTSSLGSLGNLAPAGGASQAGANLSAPIRNSDSGRQVSSQLPSSMSSSALFGCATAPGNASFSFASRTGASFNDSSAAANQQHHFPSSSSSSALFAAAGNASRPAANHFFARHQPPPPPPPQAQPQATPNDAGQVTFFAGSPSNGSGMAVAAGRPPPTPSMLVPSPSASMGAGAGFGGFGAFSASQPSSGMIVGSAPMSGANQIGANVGGGGSGGFGDGHHQQPRFSASVAANLHQRLASSAASVQSATSGLSRQTNPFDDDFFA